MKKGIKAIYQLPKEYYFKFEDEEYFKMVENYLHNNFDISFEIALIEDKECEYTQIYVDIINDTFMEVEKDLQDFKYFIKECTRKHLKQIFKMKYEKVF